MRKPRHVLSLLVATGVMAAVGTSACGPGPARHVILFIGDGMQLAYEVAASRYLYDRDDGLAWHGFPYRTPVATWDVTTYDKFATLRHEAPYDPAHFAPSVGYDPALGGDRPYPLVDSDTTAPYFFPSGQPLFATDSASSATAFGTGYKTDDGNIAWLPGDPSNGGLYTAAELLRTGRGFAIGVVSTVPFTHATPAAQVSHNLNRNRYLEIAAEIVRSVKPEVVIGGGHPDSTTTYMSRALLAELRNDPSYVVAERRAGANGTETLASAAQAARAAGKRLFGLFGGPDGNFESPVPVDAPGSPEVRRGSIEEPLLADATVAALDVLGRDPDGFFVLIEQGDIDWANHDHDYARMIGTVWDLDRAVRAAAAFVDRPGDDITWNNTLMIVTADHANGGLRFAPGARLRAGDLPAQEGKRGAFTYPGGEVSYGAAGHTNELVMLYARGAGVKTFEPFEGAWYPCTHIVDNTQIFRAMMQAAGLTLPSPLHPTVVRPASCPGEGR